jgi:aspartate aminotransferase
MQIERYLWRARRILAALAASGARLLAEAGAEVAEPAGGFYLFPDLGPRRAALQRRGVGTSVELARRLLEEVGVALLPGAAFGRDPGELCLRAALVDFDGAKAMAALETRPADAEVDQAFLEVHCRDVLAALRRAGEWLRGSGR